MPVLLVAYVCTYSEELGIVTYSDRNVDRRYRHDTLLLLPAYACLLVSSILVGAGEIRIGPRSHWRLRYFPAGEMDRRRGILGNTAPDIWYQG